jgi:transcriptional regulator with XRE-family HTH domain
MSKVQAKNAKVVGTLAARVRQCRKGAGLTQEDLAERCNIYRTYLSRIENGTANPTIGVLIALADALNLDVLKLLAE